MKKIIKSGLIMGFVSTMLALCISNQVVAQKRSVSSTITYQDFYDRLSPYGTWIDYPSYGHVWHPSITGDFRPYLTNGYWDYSDQGWLWQSNYDWGWAPFHYGRWVYDDMYGWLWIPGYEWSPAWVTWGNVDNYYAWAPLMPEVNVSIAFNSWRPSTFYWNVCGREHIYDRDIINRVEKREVINNFANRIEVINNFSNTGIHKQFYSKGPDVNEVGRYVNSNITPAAIRQVKNVGPAMRKGNEIQVYSPTVKNPQPREFRRVDVSNANPIRNNDFKIKNEGVEQWKNVDRLPMHKAPESSFGNPRGFERIGTRRH